MTALKIQRSKNRGMEFRYVSGHIVGHNDLSEPKTLIENCQGYAVGADGRGTDLVPSNLTFSGNNRDATLFVGDVCEAGCSFNMARGNGVYAFEKTLNLKGLLINGEVTLEFGPGASLVIEGTATDKANVMLTPGKTFTGINKTPGSWGGIVFKHAEGGFSGSTVEYGGQANGGNIVVENSPSLGIGESTIRHSAGCGIRGASSMTFDPAAPAAQNTFTNNAGGATCP